MSTSNTIVSDFLRPKTRGELLNALKEGIKCEVVASNEEFTTLCLQGWLKFSDFKTYKSANDGWVVYEAIKNKSI